MSEATAQSALHKAEKAHRANEQLEARVNTLESKVNVLEKQIARMDKAIRNIFSSFLRGTIHEEDNEETNR